MESVERVLLTVSSFFKSRRNHVKKVHTHPRRGLEPLRLFRGRRNSYGQQTQQTDNSRHEHQHETSRYFHRFPHRVSRYANSHQSKLRALPRVL